MHGYGAYGSIIQPEFDHYRLRYIYISNTVSIHSNMNLPLIISIPTPSMLDRGFIYALAHPRGIYPNLFHYFLLLFIHILLLFSFVCVVGMVYCLGGGEKGAKWYEEGKLLNKKNTFKDFITVCKYVDHYLLFHDPFSTNLS